MRKTFLEYVAEDLLKKYGIDLMQYKGKEINSYIEEGFMQQKDNHIFFTRKGIDISNSIIAELI